jgi:uncharacterized membrane protein
MSTIRSMGGETPLIVGPSTRAPRPFRRAVLRGLAGLCPPLFTFLIVAWVINTTKGYVLEPVTGWARQAIIWRLADVREDLPLNDLAARTALIDGRVYHQIEDGRFIPKEVFEAVKKEPGETPPITAEGYYRRYVDLNYLRPFYTVPFLLLLFVFFLYILGKFMTAGIGAFLVGVFDRFVSRVPGVRSVYSAAKQVSDFVFSGREVQFNRIVAVEYPRHGVWSIGFVTGESFSAIRDVAGGPVLTVMIPYSPLSVTGYTITVRKSECIDLNITFEQACQFIVSCGVVVPPQQLARLQTEKAGAEGEAEPLVRTGTAAPQNGV